MSVDLIWEDPPEDGRGNGKVPWKAIVAELRARPGEWAIVWEGTATQAGAKAQHLRRYFPGVESVSRKGKVYARAVEVES